MIDIQDLLQKLVSQSELVMSSPATKERLIQDGVISLEEKPILSIEEGINQLFESRKRNALLMARKIPPLMHTGVSTQILYLYDEIRECMLFGLNGAAITLSSILVEFVLKYASYTCEMGGFANYDSKKWGEFEDLEFGDAVGKAAKAGLLSKAIKKELSQFREIIRNPYIHYNIKKITESVTFENVGVLNIKTGELTTENIDVKDKPFFRAHAKRIVDGNTVLNVFLFANRVVESMVKQLNERFICNKSNKARASRPEGGKEDEL